MNDRHRYSLPLSTELYAGARIASFFDNAPLRMTRFAAIVALLVLALASAVRAQSDETGGGAREVRETPLPGIAGAEGLSHRVATRFGGADYYETSIQLRWADADDRARSQFLVEAGSLGTAPARSYRASVARGGIELSYPSGNRYDDGGQTTRERWELDGARFVRRWRRTTSPNRRALRRMETALARGDFPAARRIAAQLEASPNGGHTDQTGAVFLAFLRATVRVASAEHAADPRAAAARLAELLDAPPVDRPDAGDDAHGLCLQEELRACPPQPRIVLAGGEEALRLVNDAAFLLDEGGEHARAIELLVQVVELSPERPAAQLNLADALWAVERRGEARAHYAEYARLRAGAEIPARVIERAR